MVPDDNPNRGVSKVALLKFSNEYIVKLHAKVDKRDAYIEKLRQEVARLRNGGEGEEVKMVVPILPGSDEEEEDDELDGLSDEEGEGGMQEEEVDLLEYDVAAGEEEDEEEDEEGEEAEGEGEREGEAEDDEMDDGDREMLPAVSSNKRGRHSLPSAPVGGTSGPGRVTRLTRVPSATKLKGRKSD